MHDNTPWKPLEGWDNEQYKRTCAERIKANQAMVEETEELLRHEKDKYERAHLKMQLDGWKEWVERWARRLADAERASK